MKDQAKRDETAEHVARMEVMITAGWFVSIKPSTEISIGTLWLGGRVMLKVDHEFGQHTFGQVYAVANTVYTGGFH